MLDPQHPNFARIFVSARVDHLAPASETVNPQPICGQKSHRHGGMWDEYPIGSLTPYPDVRPCSRCAALVAD